MFDSGQGGRAWADVGDAGSRVVVVAVVVVFFFFFVVVVVVVDVAIVSGVFGAGP